MKKTLTALCFIFLLCGLALTTQAKEKKNKKVKDTYVTISTDYGVMVLKLYNETPQHRDNFTQLVKSGFYDSLMFHRVIKNFMIQGGDPNSKHAIAGQSLGSGEVKGAARIPAEFNPNLYHKKGALAAARDMNPQKASSNCQFYIVQGKINSDADLDMMENRKGIKYTEAQRNVYKTIGGTPFLDNDYTVFGELLHGFSVLDQIAGTKVGTSDRPVEDIRMQMKILKKYKAKKYKNEKINVPKASTQNSKILEKVTEKKVDAKEEYELGQDKE